jgi:acyl carrier protein
MEERKDKIRQFLARFFKNRTIGDGENIFELGFVNSLLALQLVQFLEKEFGITVEDDDLDLANFSTIDAMAALIERKQGSPAEVRG